MAIVRGYRSLCVLMGIEADQYPAMRLRMTIHFQENRDLYELDIHSVVTPFPRLVQNTAHIGRVERPEQWMELPMVGLAFATEFQIPLVCLSYIVPMLCLPMASSAPQNVPTVARLGIANVGQRNHFVPVSNILHFTCKHASYLIITH